MRRRCLIAVALLSAASCRGSSRQDKIAFVSMRSDPPGVHVIFADGSQAVRVSTSRAFLAAAPLWSPDGRRLAYTVERGPDAWAIELYDVTDGTATQAAKGMKLEDWTPDGAWLIGSSLVDPDDLLADGKKRRKRQQLYAIAADGSGKTVKLSDASGWDFSPAVSPDGTRVAFVSNRNDKVELRLVNVTGGGGKRLLDVRGDDVLGSPAWSPDGTTIVFECKRGAEGVQRLCRIGAGGGAAPDLTAGWAASPSWSPDGKRIAYVAKDAAGNEQVWVSAADGSGATMLTKEGRNTLPAWSPDGTRVAFVSDRTGNAEIMVVPAAGGSAVNVTENPSRDLFPVWQPVPAAPAS